MSNSKLKFPFEIHCVEPDVNAELLQYFHGERTGFVQVGPEKYFFPSKYKEEAEAYYNFTARSDDIWIATFPRSGTTLTQELVWLLANNLDFTGAKKPLTERFPFFEFPLFVHPHIKAELLKANAHDAEKLKFIEEISCPGYESLEKITTRRFIKTHFPFSLLPPSVMEKKCKVIYVTRNPKDVAVSFYHLNRLFRTQGYVGDFERYWKYFEQGLNPWMPYYSHVNEALAHRYEPNLLFLSYEEMKENLSSTIGKVAKFLDCKLSAEGLEELINHLNISNFRNNCSVNGEELKDIGILNNGEEGFIRTGGGADGNGLQGKFIDNPKLQNRIETWIETNQSNLEKTL